MATDLERKLKDIVGRGWVEPEAAEPYLTEWRGVWQAKRAMVVRPASTDEVARVVACCAEAGVPVVPQGGNTGLAGGAIPYPDETAVVVNLGRMNRIRSVDPENFTLTAEAGCVLADVQAAAETVDRLFPLSLGAEGSCQIGGNLATNAGGVAVLKYGNARDLVLGLEVVLPDGTLWDGLRSLRKDNTGYDLKHLFLGAEGTLGIITAAVLKLFPRPRSRQTAFIALRDLNAAITLLARLRSATGDQVTSFEYLPRSCIDLVLQHLPGTSDPLAERHEHYALIEIAETAADDAGLAATVEDALAAALEEGLILDAAIAQNAAQASAFWHLRDSLAEAQLRDGPTIRHDVSIPISQWPAFYTDAANRLKTAFPDLRLHAFGHVGDGNIHFNVAGPTPGDSAGGDPKAFLALGDEVNRLVHDCVRDYGGSISAEHGIGRLRRDELAHYKDPVELALMRRIKAALDPNGLMNPGKVL